MRFSILPLLLFVSAATAPAQIEQRVDALLARMTLEEKLGQMSQSSAFRDAGIPDRIKEEIRKGRWGSFLNAGTFADRAEAQRIAVKESRLGIPLIFGRDVIHGYRTVVPIPLGQSASWDPESIRQAARTAGRETAASGIHCQRGRRIDSDNLFPCRRSFEKCPGPSGIKVVTRD